MVAIRVSGLDQNGALQAIAAAFAEVEQIHHLMSYHEKTSDIGRLNRAKPGVPVPVDPRTLEVMEFSLSLSDLSGGWPRISSVPAHGQRLESLENLGLDEGWGAVRPDPGEVVEDGLEGERPLQSG